MLPKLIDRLPWGIMQSINSHNRFTKWLVSNSDRTLNTNKICTYDLVWWLLIREMSVSEFLNMIFSFWLDDFSINHNDNKILRSDWPSAVQISALIGQCNKTVRVMLVSNCNRARTDGKNNQIILCFNFQKLKTSQSLLKLWLSGNRTSFCLKTWNWTPFSSIAIICPHYRKEQHRRIRQLKHCDVWHRCVADAGNPLRYYRRGGHDRLASVVKLLFIIRYTLFYLIS